MTNVCEGIRELLQNLGQLQVKSPRPADRRTGNSKPKTPLHLALQESHGCPHPTRTQPRLTARDWHNLGPGAKPATCSTMLNPTKQRNYDIQVFWVQHAPAKHPEVSNFEIDRSLSNTTYGSSFDCHVQEDVSLLQAPCKIEYIYVHPRFQF